MKKQNTTLILVECALMIAMATVLSMFKIFELPQGGSITCASMVPMVILSFRHGPKWGLTAAFAESLLQMILKFDAPTAKTFIAFTLVILLDYVLAFTSVGAASIFGKPFKNRMVSVGVGAFCVSVLRFLCSFVSGIVNWADYTPKGTPVWIYSLTYNGSYMIPEAIITVVVSIALIQVLDRVEKRMAQNA
ncbi:MAG TPA: energy-coupled thiamine transporter ThiT [Oscillospiraceae bacterium]|nr:energy-coupled thiamine transporter ThiT [Oscillospiraceae bacterium]